MEAGVHKIGRYISIFYERSEDITEALLRHMLITGLSVLFACIVAIPIGIYLSKTSLEWIKSIVFTITNIFQTIPSLAMLAIFIPLIGIGLKPAIIALFLYSLLPILRNTYAAFESIDEGIVESRYWYGVQCSGTSISNRNPIGITVYYVRNSTNNCLYHQLGDISSLNWCWRTRTIDHWRDGG